MKPNIQDMLYNTSLGGYLSAPFIYLLIVPFLFMDLSVTLYQQICFRLWGIPRVKRGAHVILDRHDLPHMSFRERMNCLYCDYAQGVLGYAREVTGATEHFWCPIKHKNNYHGQTGNYDGYMGREETDDFRKKLWAERVNKCRACKSQGECNK